jgi:hypothetical protein
MRAILVVLQLVGSMSHGAVNITLLDLSTGAAALDGSPYGFFFLPSVKNSTQWTISIEGGGWCVGEDNCLARAEQTMHDGKPGSLGSSTPLLGHPSGCGCMNTEADGLADDCNCIYMPYLDGGSFSGNRDKPWPVKSKPGKFLHYRGLTNLDATLDFAFSHLGLDKATAMVVTGGSAGGLSTFLHVDRVADRMKAAPACNRTTAAPVVGYFLDHAKYAAPTKPNVDYPHTGNYSSWMKILYEDQNITAALLPACLAAFPSEPHLCFMSPHMVKFVQSPFFMFNSRFDAWQMDNDLQVTCSVGDKGHRPCSTAEQAAIVQYGADFLSDLKPVIASTPKNGGFITSCICHGCPWSTLTLDNATSYQHYARWHRGQDGSSMHIDSRPPNGGGALASDPLCMSFP